MARKGNNLNNKERIVAYILAYGTIFIAVLAVFLLNLGLFFRSSKVADNSSMELPLSHAVVSVCEDSLKIWIEKADWVKYKSGTLYPDNAQTTKYQNIINKNGLAERLSVNEGFEWIFNDKKNEFSFEMPTFKESHVTYVTVPTWIIYELAK